MSNPTSTLSLFLSMVGGLTNLNGQNPLALIQNTNSPGNTISYVFQSGNTTVNVPNPASSACLYFLGYVNGGTTIAFKGVNGDTGIVMTVAGWVLFPVTGLTNFVVNCSAQTIVNVFWI